MVFSPTALFDAVHHFAKSVNAVKGGGGESLIFEINKLNTPCDISNSLFSSLMKTTHKTNIEAYSGPQGSKIGSLRDFQVLKAYFPPPRSL